jgi:hypothetical protein
LSSKGPTGRVKPDHVLAALHLALDAVMTWSA